MPNKNELNSKIVACLRDIGN